MNMMIILFFIFLILSLILAYLIWGNKLHKLNVSFIISVIITLLLAYVNWGHEFHKTNVSVGPFSFELSFKHDDTDLIKIIEYINSPEVNENMNNWCYNILNNYYFKETSEKSFIDKFHSWLFKLRNSEPKIVIIRRVLAQLLGIKSGKILAAEKELKKNIDISPNYIDYIFLGQVLSHKEPLDHSEIILCFEKALEFPECKRDKANYKRSLGNIHLRKGHMSFNQNKYHEAIDEYLRVVEINEYSFTAYHGLGISYERINNYHKALENYDNVIIYSNDPHFTVKALSNKSKLIVSKVGELKNVNKCESNECLKMIKHALYCISLAIQKFESSYSDYPVGSPKMNELAKMLYFRAHIYSDLNDIDKKLIDLKNAFELTTDHNLKKDIQRNL